MSRPDITLVLHDSSSEAERVCALLDDVRTFATSHIDAVGPGGIDPCRDLLVVVDLAAPSILPRLKALHLHSKDTGARHVFAIHAGSRREAVQASALGATSTIPMPLQLARIEEVFRGPQSAAAASPWHDEPAPLAEGLDAAADMISRILEPNLHVGPGFMDDLTDSADAIWRAVERAGIAAWLAAVRGHHSRTFRHCMMVAGYVAAFAQALRFCRRDRNLLLIAGLLHDVGKSEIPLAILDKPGRLDRGEMELMHTHPVRGYRLLRASPEIEADILDVVLHHHELLDGSGYPDGLAGAEIADLVRLTTIADIFSALVEERAYKAPMTPEEALKRLEGMGPKLDQPLVQAFRTVALAE